MGETKKGYPFGFYVVAASFSFERFAYYAAKWLLTIFVVTAAAEGGLGLAKEEGAVFSSYLVAFTYATPLIGGAIADRWVGARYLIPIGEIIMGLGYLCAWQAHDKTMVWAMIILVSVGTGFFKGNLSGINGRLFDDPELLDSAFSIQYSFVNIGSFLGTTIMGMYAVTLGYRTAFLVCGIMLFVDCAWWIFGMKFLGEAGKKPFLVDNREVKGAAAKADKAETAPLTTLEKKRVAAIVICTVLSGVFWTFWYLLYLPVYYEFGPIEQGGLGWANWNIGSFQIPTSFFDSLNAFLCIGLGPALAIVWKKMAARPQGDLSMFRKTALGLIILGAGVGVLALAGMMSGSAENPVSIFWIVLAGTLMTVGEMVFSPLGNSFISKYAPTKLLGTLLGVWPLINFFVGLIYGHLYNFLCSFAFVPAFGAAAIVIVLCGVALWACDGKLNKLVTGE